MPANLQTTHSGSAVRVQKQGIPGMRSRAIFSLWLYQDNVDSWRTKLVFQPLIKSLRPWMLWDLRSLASSKNPFLSSHNSVERIF
jgi:hypothetical protein